MTNPDRGSDRTPARPAAPGPVRALRALLGLGLVAMVGLNVANAAGRYGGFATLTGADELLVYAMIWIVMVGAILAARGGEHLNIDLLPSALPGTAATLVAVTVDLVTLAVCAFIAFHSWTFIARIAAIGQTSMGLGVPMTWPHAAVLVGFAGIAAAALASLVARVLGRDARRGGGQAAFDARSPSDESAM